MGWLAAVLSGTLAAFSYPTRFGAWMLPDLGFLAFFCWVPLFQALRNVSPRRAFFLSFAAGAFQYGASKYWLYSAMHGFGGLSPTVSVLVLLFLVVILSAYFGLIFYLSQWVCRRLKISPIWVRPLFWVGIEYLRTHGPVEGHPWSQIAYSQGGFLTFIQVADLFGVYAVTYLLVLANEAASLVLSYLRGKERSPLFPSVGYALVLLSSGLLYGYFSLHREVARPVGILETGIVQGNIPQEEKWEAERFRQILQSYQEGTRELEERGAQWILWPEASFPLGLAYDAEKVPLSLGTQKADLLFGAITHAQGFPGPRRERPSYNSALLVNGQGEILDYYHKRHLVPLGEYVPYADILVFAKKLTAEVGDLRPGPSFRPIHYQNYRLGVLICYEDIFPNISRIMVEDGANALINLTNDAWYGYSSAAYQHQVFSQFRSVETRRSLIRATNTGISSQIDPWGRVLWQGGLFLREDFLTRLPLYAGSSLYVKIGDKLPQFFLMLCLLVMVRAFLKGRGLPKPG